VTTAAATVINRSDPCPLLSRGSTFTPAVKGGAEAISSLITGSVFTELVLTEIFSSVTGEAFFSSLAVVV
jgi:hypothetical protein